MSEDEIMKRKKMELIVYELKRIFGIPPEEYATMGIYYGIYFEVRPKENGHNIPHFHAIYQEKEISVSLTDFKVIKNSGFNNKEFKKVIKFAMEHKEEFINEWESYHGIIV